MQPSTSSSQVNAATHAFAQTVDTIAEHACAAGLHLVTAESCTGGYIAKVLTDKAGSSQWFDAGLVTYSNAAKQIVLGVQADTLATHGAVSEATAREMVAGALDKMAADVAVAVTGIAGPSGGSAHKPVGTVWIAWQRRGHAITTQVFHFAGNREQVRRATVDHALHGLVKVLTS